VADKPRPQYVGFGRCDGGHIDVKLYKIPGTKYEYALLCKHCLAERGYEEPRARTAEDIEVIDGGLAWKRETK
jgi:hypothetical protein